MSDPLARLADVHEPPTPDAAALGLWSLNAGLLLALMALLYWRRRRARSAWRREALYAVRQTRNVPPETALPALATTLRRVARLRLGETVTTLEGDAWLDALDRCFATRWFSDGAGRAFGNALYRRATPQEVDVGGLAVRIEALLKRLPATRPGQR